MVCVYVCACVPVCVDIGLDCWVMVCRAGTPGMYNLCRVACTDVSTAHTHKHDRHCVVTPSASITLSWPQCTTQTMCWNFKATFHNSSSPHPVSRFWTPFAIP